MLKQKNGQKPGTSSSDGRARYRYRSGVVELIGCRARYRYRSGVVELIG